ncbi:phloretin hydrolase [Fusarium mundagurra]|uniref:Phloretin hydrolase n=1 Tax=Fusarium mundagurra TaxID=1567541 RepID=A0A8H5YHT7_9HYPO|nr:phloretin hydrolase [Fusarium mundagurra]
MKIQLVPVLEFASFCLAQVAANPPDGKHYSPIPLITLSENSTSVNVAPYQSNTSQYYLGYKGEDWSRPFVKYWNPAVNQISDEVQKGITESPYASSLVAHQYAYRMANAIDWSNKTLPERYIGSYSWIDEFIGNFATKLTVNFVDPATFGFNTSAFESQGIETIVIAHITSGNSYLMHQIRRKDDGQRELRSRFFLDVFRETQGHDLSVHCAVELSHLATVLPHLFAEFKDTV